MNTPETQTYQTVPADPLSEVERLNREVEALRRRLSHSQRLASIGTMAAMVAHEFNNILTPVISYAQLAQKDPRLAKKAISKAVSGGLRATEICKAILGLTRDVPAEAHPFRVLELLNETVTAMVRDPQKDGIEFVCNVPPHLLITVPRVEFQQVLLNLLINARAAVLDRPTPRRIVVSANIEDGYLLVDITDNGMGIASENLTRVFDPFFTTKTGSKKQPRGSGLGLAICREILQAMSGDISLESAVNVGTTFTLRLPATLPTQTFTPTTAA